MDRLQNPNTFRSASTAARRTIATYSSYAEAQKAVDYLSDNSFAVERTAIVAEGLKFVEQVTGRLNWGRVISTAASSGALTGVLIGLFFGLFFGGQNLLGIVLYGLIVGIIISILFGVLGYAATRGQRDFSSVGGMQAERYNVMVDVDAAEEAERVLQGLR
jgi:uncharacterized protein YacL